VAWPRCEERKEKIEEEKGVVKLFASFAPFAACRIHPTSKFEAQ